MLALVPKTPCVIPPNQMNQSFCMPVRVKTKGNTKSVITYGFYDNGSGGYFLRENLREQLGVNDERMELQLSIMHGQSLVTTMVVKDLVVTDMEDKYPIEIPWSYTRMKIPMTEQQIPTPEFVEQWEHLRSFQKGCTSLYQTWRLGCFLEATVLQHWNL